MSIKELKNLVADGKTDVAIRLLIQKIESFREQYPETSPIREYNDLILLLSRLSRLESSNSRGILSNEVFNRDMAKINNDLFTIIDNLPNKFIIWFKKKKTESKKPSTKKYKYDFFLSFSGKNLEEAYFILNQFKKNHLRVFMSDAELKNHQGTDFTIAINNAITESEHFIILCTPESMASIWVRKEYSAFFQSCHIPSNEARKLFIIKGKRYSSDLLIEYPLLSSFQVSDGAMDIIKLLPKERIIENLKDEIEQIRKCNQKLTKRLDHYTSYVKQLNLRIAKLDKENIQYKQKTTLTAQQIEQYRQQEIEAINEDKRLKVLQKEKNELEKQLTKLIRQIDSNKKQITNLQNEKQNAQDKLKSLKEQCQKQEEKYTSTIKDIDNADKLLTALKNENDTYEKQKKEYKNQINTLKKNSDRLKISVGELKQQIERYETELSQMKNTKEQIQLNINSLSHQKQKLKTDNKQLEDKIRSLHSWQRIKKLLSIIIMLLVFVLLGYWGVTAINEYNSDEDDKSENTIEKPEKDLPRNNEYNSDEDDKSENTIEEPENDLPRNMVFVEGGTFKMGSNNGYDDEKPVHTVTLDDFYISRYEVTHAEYIKFMNDIGVNSNGSHNGKEYVDMDDEDCAVDYRNGSFYFKGSSCADSEDCPMIEVTWYGAKAYCEWAGGRLPTEAEWEYAARGGSVEPRRGVALQYAGSNTIDEVAWYSGNSDSKTHPVGQKKPNELGLYDMSGNVWEWCNDWYGGDYYAESKNSTNPTGPSSGSLRVGRGGGWGSYAAYCRSAYRCYWNPDYSYDNLGFRLVFVP